MVTGMETVVGDYGELSIVLFISILIYVYKTVFFILTMQTTEKCLQTSGLNHKDVVLSGQYFTFLLALQTFCLAPPKKNSR